MNVMLSDGEQPPARKFFFDRGYKGHLLHNDRVVLVERGSEILAGAIIRQGQTVFTQIIDPRAEEVLKKAIDA